MGIRQSKGGGILDTKFRYRAGKIRPVLGPGLQAVVKQNEGCTGKGRKEAIWGGKEVFARIRSRRGGTRSGKGGLRRGCLDDGRCRRHMGGAMKGSGRSSANPHPPRGDEGSRRVIGG